MLIYDKGFFTGLHVLLCFLKLSSSFNIETSYAKIFHGDTGSYFGYTVALVEKDRRWVLVGAPKANDSTLTTAVQEPGVLYKCPPDNNKCQPVPVDHHGNVNQACSMNGEEVEFNNNKDRAWLGSSLDVMKNTVVVCAQRWKNMKSDQPLMNGMCYEISKDLTAAAAADTKCLPALINCSRQLVKKKYDCHMGIMGISATRFNTKSEISIMGAPGMQDFAGGIVKIFSKNNEAHSRVIQRPRDLGLQAGFVGYSVNMGKYFDDRHIYYAAGGPRVGDVGEVYIFSEDATSLEDSQIKVVLQGEQLGGYFGGVLCTADVNKDGIDDLLVGAPIYSSDEEEGAVYLYLGPLVDRINSTSVMNGLNVKKARFGSAITNLGDLNDDSYDDIAVGAPYEDGSGVVYIYNGHKNGVWSKFTQRIKGSVFDSNIQGFGSSFSRPLDMDGNGYKDFAVGAYSSDTAVLLYTRSVLPVDVTMTLDPEFVHPNREVQLKICFFYEGDNMPKRVKLDLLLEMDTKRTNASDIKRAYAKQGGKLVSSINDSQILHMSLSACFKYEVYFKLTSEDASEDVLFIPDLVTPIIFESKYKIEDTECDHICTMQKTFNGADLDPWKLSFNKSVNFLKDCGDDNLCESALELSKVKIQTESSDNFITITTTTPCQIFITVENKGEAAYAARVNILFSKVASRVNILFSKVESLVQSDAICFNRENSTITCNIGNPLKSGEKISLKLHLEVPKLDIKEETLDFDIQTKTTSKDISQISLTEKKITMDLKLDNNLDLASKAIPSLFVSSDRGYRNNESQWTYFSHLGEFRNMGPSTIPAAFLRIHFPKVTFENEDLLLLDNSEIVPNLVEVPVPDQCNRSYDVVTSEKFVTDCSAGKCRMTCYKLFDLPPGHTVSVNLTFRADTDILKKVNLNKMSATTSFEVEIKNLPNLLRKEPSYRQEVTTEIYPPKPPPEPVEVWVIVLSVLGGLIFLFLVIFILYKLNFFKRQKKEDMERKLGKKKDKLLGRDESSLPDHHQVEVTTAGESTELTENDKLVV
ncbi:hypothetical protein ScPMuIL_015392 [Solemya velum]